MFPIPSVKAQMNPQTTFVGERWRIGFLTDALVRLEWSDSGVFEDEATQVVLNRSFEQETPKVSYSQRGGMHVWETASIRLVFDGQSFSKEGLSAVVKNAGGGFGTTWHYGDEGHANLKGTARTLDGVDGACELGMGLISRDGWAILDDSKSNLLQSDEAACRAGCVTRPRGHSEIDIYFFSYGNRYADAIRDFYCLSGPTPLLPRWALGNWWSRYYPYSQDEYLALMDRFNAEGIPFTTAVLDMDWHITDVDPRFGSGWTGYSWNRELIPDPRAFTEALHERGLRISANVHPRDGIRAFEDAYPKAAETMGIDPASEEPVEFDLTDPSFIRAYFDMHHDLETDGVDFWWIDWQQGGVSRQKGLDPLWILNYLHYMDMVSASSEGEDQCRTLPLILSRYAGPGSHRYPVGFSGDTVVSWESLKFQPYFTSTASNIGYGWWSHDIGGHMLGLRDEELEARWYQLGVFSPINRLHSSLSPFVGKEPWNFQQPVRDIMRDALILRHRLIPYLHTMNWCAATEGAPLVTPMYWAHPDAGIAYDVHEQFMFGTQLMVAPVVTPRDTNTRQARTRMWFPRGQWFDFFTGRRYDAEMDGGLRMNVWRPLELVPVFAPAGGIVPLQKLDQNINDCGNPQALEILVFPGADGHFTLREDDGRYPGVTCEQRSGEVRTEIVYDDALGTLTIHPAEGCTDALPALRSWTVTMRGVEKPTQVSVNGESTEFAYDPDTLSVCVTIHEAEVSQELEVSFACGKRPAFAENPVENDIYQALLRCEMDALAKDDAYEMVRRLGRRALPQLRTLDRGKETGIFRSEMPASVIEMIEEILLRS